MRMRSLGLAGVIGLALAWGYPAGQAAAPLSSYEREAIQRQQNLITTIEDDIKDRERQARTAWILGDCRGYQRMLSLFNFFAEFGFEGRLGFGALPKDTKEQLRAQVRLVVASLPPNCDPDPFIRSSLANEGDPADIAGGNDD